MNSAFPPSHMHTDWKVLYRAAILERDKSVIRQRVSEAETAVRSRSRELFYDGGTSEEKELLADALYALCAYRTAWEHAEGEMTVTAAKIAA